MINYSATFQTGTYDDAVELLNDAAAKAGLKIMNIEFVYVSPELLHEMGHWNAVSHHTFEFRAVTERIQP